MQIEENPKRISQGALREKSESKWRIKISFKKKN